MAVKIRKQVYIEPRQERMLKSAAKKSGTPEAEIIRRALDEHLREIRAASSRSGIWNKEMAFIKRRMAEGPLPGRRTWLRDELHER